jgi:hypothetical protein
VGEGKLRIPSSTPSVSRKESAKALQINGFLCNEIHCCETFPAAIRPATLRAFAEAEGI